MTITKKDIITSIQAETSLTTEKAQKLFEGLITEISAALVKGENVKCAQFGTFTVNTRDERIGRDPNTGNKLQIQASANTYFHASSKINNQLNVEEDWF